MKYQFSVTKTTNPKAKPDPDTLGFGTEFTDHMFLLDYKEGKGWHNGRIVPYGPIELDPAALVFHYGQEMFEGLKAYKDPNGSDRTKMWKEQTTQTKECAFRKSKRIL